MNTLHKAASEAWQLYQGRGRISRTLLRSHVYRAWERSHLQKASPLHMKAEQLSALDTQRLLAKRGDLIQAAQPYMKALSAAAGQEKHAAMLGDHEAIVLDVMADPATLYGLEGFPTPGSILQEALSGANGIGTPLMENAYAELIGAEHFIQGFHPFTCQGVPIYGPGLETIGVLSTSVRRPEASQRLKEIMIVAAQGIGADLILRQLESLLQTLVATAQLTPEVWDKLRQDLIQIYAAGRMNIELAALHISRAKDEAASPAQRLLQAAGQAMEKFRAQSLLCRNLATTKRGASECFEVMSLVMAIEELLGTELRVRRVAVEKKGLQSAWIHADQRQLEKSILRLFLQGIAAAAGGVLVIELGLRHDDGTLEIIFTGYPESNPGAYTQRLPLPVAGETL